MKMRVSIVCITLLLACVTCVVVGASVAESEWIQPIFIESLSLPAPGQHCGAGNKGVCTAKTTWCPPSKGTIQHGLCAGSAVCCYPHTTAAAPAPTRTPAPAAPTVPAHATATGGVTVPRGGPLSSIPRTITIPADILALGVQYTRAPKAAPVSNACSSANGGIMPDAVLSKILVALWKAFGANDAQAADYARRNLKQIHRESTGCPNVLQGKIGDVNNKNGNLAGGLVQFISPTFNFWHVAGTANNKFNPVSNLAAAINAQINSQTVYPHCHTNRVLNGCMGWSPSGGSNPYRG